MKLIKNESLTFTGIDIEDILGFAYVTILVPKRNYIRWSKWIYDNHDNRLIAIRTPLISIELIK